METVTIRGQTTYRMSPEVQRKLSQFKEEHPYISINNVIDHALSFYLDYAANGVDGKLNPIKKPKL